MCKPSNQSSAKVYLVGAGPGDPGLITVPGAACMAKADAVLYDYLVNPRILAMAPAGAELICLSKHGRSGRWTQNEICRQLIDFARRGKTVVRLKNGDPAVFGRAGEELEALSAAEIPFEVVPGVTAGLAAGSCSGIAVTDRRSASAVALVTGHEQHQKGMAPLDYESLARFPGTLVFYMGVSAAPAWSHALISSGKAANTPVAIVRNCSLPDQQTIVCSLGEVAQLMRERDVRPPVVVIVGAVAGKEEIFNWFERRPLSGQCVLITRAAEQAGSLSGQLEELGAVVVCQPAIEIAPPADWQLVDAALSTLPQYDWLVFSSSNGVRFFLNRLLATGRDLRCLGSVRLAVIGPGTAEELSRFRLNADLQPDSFRAEALAAALVREQAFGKRFLLVRASRGRDVLAIELEQAGGLVEQVVAYRSTDCPSPEPHIATALSDGAIDFTTITSSAIARSMHAMFGERLSKTRLVSISPVTSQTLRELGHEPAVEAAEYTMRGVVEAIVREITSGKSADTPGQAAT